MSARRGVGSPSVVTCVSRARFFTSPHASPSGVSDGHNIPHWLGCSARGPETLRVFSNWLVTRVIMPRAAMYDSRLSCCVTPARSILKRFRDQFPVDTAFSMPFVIVSTRMCFSTSKGSVRFVLARLRSAAERTHEQQRGVK